jgi:hypothetical protein
MERNSHPLPTPISAPGISPSSSSTTVPALSSWKNILKTASSSLFGDVMQSLFVASNNTGGGGTTTTTNTSTTTTTTGLELSFTNNPFPSNLDGTYLSERVAIVGPARTKTSEKDKYRNDSQALSKFLSERHGGAHRIMYFDFGSRGSLDANGLNYAIIEMDLERPTLQVLREAVAAVYAWLALDPKHIAVLTCSNGIKSTMLVSACLMAKAKKCKSTREGLRMFFSARLSLKKPVSVYF